MATVLYIRISSIRVTEFKNNSFVPVIYSMSLASPALLFSLVGAVRGHGKRRRTINNGRREFPIFYLAMMQFSAVRAIKHAC